MRVARVEPEGDAAAGLVKHDVLAPDRPVAGERPVVDAQPLGELVGVGFVERATPSAEAKRSLRP